MILSTLLIAFSSLAAMAIGIELRLPRSCTAGDACWIEYAVTNTSPRTLRLPDPGIDGDHAPIFYVNGKTLPRGRGMAAAMVDLAAGGKHESAFRLDERMPLRPGTYELTAKLEADGSIVESNGVRVLVEFFRTPVFSLVTLPIPAADRAVFSWIRDNEYVEQTLIAHSEGGPVKREQTVVRATLPSSSTSATTALSGVHSNETNPMRWIFWKVGATVSALGAEKLRGPINVLLPNAKAMLIEHPLMGAAHRADAFFLAEAGSTRTLLIARFCDPISTPNEKSRVLVTAAMPPGAVTLALDPPAYSKDRRHVLTVSLADPGQVIVHHATLQGVSGELSAFRRVVRPLPLETELSAGSTVGAYVDETGSVHVVISGSSKMNRRRLVWIDAVLTEELPPAVRQFEVQSNVASGRTYTGGMGGWRLDNGDAVVFPGPPSPLLQVPAVAGSRPPQEFLRLAGRIYALETGPNGLQLIPLPGQ